MLTATRGPSAPAIAAGTVTGGTGAPPVMRASRATASRPFARRARRSSATSPPVGRPIRTVAQNPLRYAPGSTTAYGSSPGCSARTTSRRGIPDAVTGWGSPSPQDSRGAKPRPRGGRAAPGDLGGGRRAAGGGAPAGDEHRRARADRDRLGQGRVEVDVEV